MTAEAFTNDSLENFENKLDNTELELKLAEQVMATKKETQEEAHNILKTANADKLATFMKQTFCNESGRQPYNQMRKNDCYFFTVEAAIDLLSDKLVTPDGKEKKFKTDGTETQDSDGKTLDEYLADAKGIDNQYSRELVRQVQKILKLNPADGLAGPQFFAKVYSILSGTPISEFKVQGFEGNNRYRYGLDEDIANYNQQVEVDNNTKQGIIKELNLAKLANAIDLTKRGVGNGTDVFISTAEPNCYYYFSGTTLKAVNTLGTYAQGSSDNLLWATKSYEASSKKWNLDYNLVANDEVAGYLNAGFKETLEKYDFKSTGKEVIFEGGELYVSSFGLKHKIPLDIQTNSAATKLGHTCKIFDYLIFGNLANYLKSEEYRNHSPAPGKRFTVHDTYIMQGDSYQVTYSTSYKTSYKKILENNKISNDGFENFLNNLL